MKKALIVWGGWEGHEPEKVAVRLAQELEKRDYSVTATSNFGIIISEEIESYDVIIPIWSCGIKGDVYLENLLDLIKKGVGLATFHGGINWFNDEKYYEMIGGFYLYDSKPENYEVKIVDEHHPLTKGQVNFTVNSEKYFLQVDPFNKVLSYASFSGVDMPISWTRTYGEGRIFYSTLAHSFDEIFREENLSTLFKAIDWCARK